jgi:hypothetical protein
VANIVWSSGGGTQSAAIAILILQGKLPRPDYAVIADTGRETRETWEYLAKVVNPALLAVDLQVTVLTKPQPPPIFNKSGSLLMPVFVTGEAKFSNFCSSYWKREPVKQWATDLGILPVVNWLGISADETGRIRTPRAANWLLHYPLVFDVRKTRNDCVRLIEEFGWPRAPKSSCWCCPNKSNAQWRHTRDNLPDEWEQAVSLDYEMRETKPDAFLHESRLPLAQAPIDADDDLQGKFGCDSGDCFV